MEPIEPFLTSRPLRLWSLTSTDLTESLRMPSEPIRPVAYDVPVEATTRAMTETAIDGDGRRREGRRMVEPFFGGHRRSTVAPPSE